MKKIQCLFLLLGLLTTSFAQTRPNVVIIMADDLDSRQLSCYGGQNLKTTNIDQMAKEGLRFKSMYASEAMCVPLRASLFTGLYPAKHGSYQNHRIVNKDVKSISHYMGALGYRVALTGKNHSTWPKANFPFEIINGFEPNCVAPTDEYTMDGVKSVLADQSKPFCLFVMSINPHAPWTVGDPSEFDPAKLKLPPHWVDTKESRIEFCKYLAEVRRLDDQVGDVKKALKASGRNKNTLFIFLGEQGPQFPGGKWTLYNYGATSSMIACMPGKIKPASETSAVVQYEDILPTLIDLGGGKPIAGLDGKSFLPVLMGKSAEARTYAYGIHNNIPEGSPYPIRSIRDGRYKLIVNLMPDSNYFIKYSMGPLNKKVIWYSWKQQAATDPQAKILTDRIVHHPAMEFYDTQEDPYELKNLAGDTAYAKKIALFKSKLEEWMKEQHDTGAQMDILIPLEKQANHAKDN